MLLFSYFILKQWKRVALTRLGRAAENMKDPDAMQLRILAAVSEASEEDANTIIMTIPLETLKYASIGRFGGSSFN